jgi:hypothetical protein
MITFFKTAARTDANLPGSIAPDAAVTRSRDSAYPAKDTNNRTAVEANSSKICFAYAKGNCRRTNCRYPHVDAPGSRLNTAANGSSSSTPSLMGNVITVARRATVLPTVVVVLLIIVNAKPTTPTPLTTPPRPALLSLDLPL